MFNTSETRHGSRLERIVVTSASGKTYDLGNPNSRLFSLRVMKYKLIRKMGR